MKMITIILMLMVPASAIQAQVTIPTVRALFGVDADTKANHVAGTNADWNDDWFSDGTCCGGLYVIDTSGAAAQINRYNTNILARNTYFVRRMSQPQYSVNTSRIWYDGIMVRDHIGTDTTAFVSSNKNGDNPLNWRGGLSNPPVKNDIKDVMVHVRREGPSLSDSLYLLAALALEGTGGARYFDYEFYQTEMYFDRPNGTFKNVGPDNGHTSWKFDAAGNITQVGDIIFTVEFGSASINSLDARIWVHNSALSISPALFSWTGSFDNDGSGSPFGYASIGPKAGGHFYSGTQNSAPVWAGPFGNVSSGGVATTYESQQFMEVAVNLSKIGLDPYISTTMNNNCGLPFKRLFAKTRSSNSFTSSLKDFIGPLDFGIPEPADAQADVSMFCNYGYQVSHLTVTNYLATSTYTWSTLNGHIATNPAAGRTVAVDDTGTYVLTQKLLPGCQTHSTDTVVVGRIADCILLDHDDAPPVHRPENITTIQVAPNPASDHVMITVPASVNDPMLTMYDAAGNRVITQRLINSRSRVNTTYLRSGIYYLQVTGGDRFRFNYTLLKQ